jgi:flagellar motor switch protein FliM
VMDPSFESTTLSQSEIDALLSKLASGGDEEAEAEPQQSWKMVKVYDFRRPDKLSKDQMRTLQLIHETFGRLAGSSLSAYLRSAVQFNLVSIEQGVYGEYVERVPEGTILHILSMDPLPGNVLIGIDLLAAMAAVDRLLGGAGTPPDTVRSSTEIELALIHTLVTNMLQKLTEAWGRVVDLQPLIRDVVLDPRYVQVALRSDPVVVIALEMSLSHCSGTVTLCIPYVTIEPILPKLNAQLWFASGRCGDDIKTSEITDSLNNVEVDMKSVLGEVSITLRELLDLKEGDVMLLDRTTSQPVDLIIGGKRKFLARPGLVGKKMAVQIVGKAEDALLLEEFSQSTRNQ